ncbi:uncharacterized protein LOC124171139 [Ischnura elegans]|uniref:uncharacterized protein LOC124171139 n=1 Tax=Ischnura elegans TaxID=197161 RepID=UPI001ED8A5C7|nr:uncharacterized protein LOC124171139 [Ischnura elegans]
MDAMEMKMLLRWMLGIPRLDHLMNVYIRKRMGAAPITDNIREARLWWYGHVIQSNENSMARTVMRLSPEGRRPRGRPKMRWLARIKADLKAVNATPEDALESSGED